MKKLLISVVLSILSVMVIAPAIGNASTQISPDGTYYGTISDTNVECSYTMDLSSSGNQKIGIESNVTKMYMRIYEGPDSSGKRLISRVVKKGTKELAYNLNNGKYTIVIKKYGSYNGDFSIKTSFTSAKETYSESNNSVKDIEDKSPIPFNKPIRGQLALNDSIDIYKIYLPVSGKLTCNMYSYINNQVNYMLYDQTGKRIDSALVDKGRERFKYDLNHGEYYLAIAKHENNTGKYLFRLRFIKSGETYTEENNSLGSVKNSAGIPMYKTITGHIAENDDKDYFKVDLPIKGRYEIYVKNAPQKIRFKFYGKTGKILIRSVKGTKDKIYRITLLKGTHYLSVSKVGNYTGKYYFKINPYVKIKRFTRIEKAIKIKWSKGACSGYQIQWAKNRKFTVGMKSGLVKNQNTTGATIKNLKSNRSYYIRIRSYDLVDGKYIASSWSPILRARPR